MLTTIATRQRILFMMSGLDVIYQLQVGWREQRPNLIVCSLKRRHSRYYSVETDYWQTKLSLGLSATAQLLVGLIFCWKQRVYILTGHRFCLNSAADCPISVKFLHEEVVFFAEFRQWNIYPRYTERIFCFPNAVWALASGAFSYRLWYTRYYHCIVMWQTIKDRVVEHVRSTLTWNTAPGSLTVLPEFSQSVSKFPFYWHHVGVGADNNSSTLFTAVVYITSRNSFSSASPLHRLMRALSKTSKLHKVFHCTFKMLRYSRLACTGFVLAHSGCG